MRIIQLLLFTLFMTMMTLPSQARSVTATMTVSMNVILVCSVTISDDHFRSRNMRKANWKQKNGEDIHCDNDEPHRVSYHSRRKHDFEEEDHGKKHHSRHARWSSNKDDREQHRQKESDDNGIVWVTTEF